MNIYKKFKMAVPMVVILFICLLFACTQKNTPFGSPGTSTHYHALTLPDSMITDIYTYKDSVRSFLDTTDFLLRTFGERTRNPKIIIGNYEDTEIRALVRFTSLPSDTLYLEDPVLRLYLHHAENISSVTINVAPIDSVIFYDDYVCWESWSLMNDQWKTPGGDFTAKNIISTNHTISDSTEFIELPIPAHIVLGWVKGGWQKNTGLIVMTEGISNGFLEFNSVNNATGKPRLSFLLPPKTEGDQPRNEHRDAIYSAFIHDKKDSSGENIGEGLFIANMTPRSIIVSIDSLQNIYELFGVENQNDLRKINILQAYLTLTVKPENSVITNEKMYLHSAIPHEEIDINENIDYTQMWHYNRYRVGIENEKLKINITNLLQVLVTQKRPYNGICIVNNQRNMDFARVEFYGMTAEENLRPQISLKYSMLD